MTHLKSSFYSFVAVFIVFGLILQGCGGDPEDQQPATDDLQQEEVPPADDPQQQDPMDEQMEEMDLVETLVIENLSSMVSAVEGAGMSDDLQTGGPYTVFAPTDEAFHQAPEEIQQLLIEPDSDQLRELINLHIVEGEYTIEEIQDMGQLETIAGETLTVDTEGETITVNGVQVAFNNIEAENGIVHTVESILTEPGYAQMMNQ